VNASSSDVVMVTHSKEIPRRGIVRMLAKCNVQFPVTLELPGYMYDFGCFESTHSLSGLRTRSHRQAKAVTRSMLHKSCSSSWFRSQHCPFQLRHDGHVASHPFEPRPLTFLNAGWYVSFFTNTSRVRHQLQERGLLSAPETNAELMVQMDRVKCMVLRCQAPSTFPLLTRTRSPPNRGPQHTWPHANVLRIDPDMQWHPHETKLESSPQIVHAC
jgi:hypothetical protein